MQAADQLVLSPIQGKIVDLTEVPDPAFSSGAMGQALPLSQV